MALRAAGQPASAIACYRRALGHDPEGAETWSNLGNALRQRRGYAQSEACLRRAIELDPADPLYARNLGLTLVLDGRPELALAQFERALARDPGDPDYQFQRACALMKLGRYAEAWAGYERRFEIGEIGPRELEAPLWDGRARSDGGTVLVHAEQGHGDMIQFARFLPEALARSGRLVLECHPALKRLFAASFPSIPVTAVGEPLPAHDVRVPMLSLPGLLGVGNGAIGMAAPYLRAPADGPPPSLPPRRGRLRVGLTWAGKPASWDRSCPYERFVDLLGVPAVDFFSLQRGEAAEDVGRSRAEALVTDVGSSLRDFGDDAHVLAELDLLVSVDTAVAHLAGALGRPVWVLATHECDWRFPARGDRSPWYPSLRLFRQQAPDDWPGVVEEARVALSELARRSGDGPAPDVAAGEALP